MRLVSTLIWGQFALFVHAGLIDRLDGLGSSSQEILEVHEPGREPPEVGINKVVYHDSCNGAKEQTLATPIARAYTIAFKMKDQFTNENPYVQAFYSEDSSPPQDWLAYGDRYYKEITDRLSFQKEEYKILLKCEETETCKGRDPERHGEQVVAHTNPGTSTINFCDIFFKGLQNAKDIACDEIKDLEQYDSRERVILHEFAHLELAKKNRATGKYDDWPQYEGPAIDVYDLSNKNVKAYGVKNCYDLAHGAFHGIPSSFARYNADSWAWIATGTGAREACAVKSGKPNFKIPIFPTETSFMADL